jgi:hypothetical protein
MPIRVKRAICLVGLAFCAGHLGRAAEQTPFSSAPCGVTFTVPAGWAVTVTPPRPNTRPQSLVCTLELVPPPSQDVLSARPSTPDEPCHLGTIRIQVLASPFDTLAEQSGFSRVGGSWRFGEGTVFGTGPLTPVSGEGWSSLRGETVSHYCGAAQATILVVLGNNSRSLSITAHGNKEAVLKSLLPSVRVLP